MPSGSSAQEAFAQAIAGFAASAATQCGHPDIRQAIAVRLIDTIGCMRGAAHEEAVAHARDMALRFSSVAPGAIGASIACAAPRVSVEAAAFVNGVAARYLDFNDIYLSKEAVHPSDNISAAMALAEALESSGSELIAALAAGYETHCRLADAVSTRKGKWDNVVLGAIAASVMAGTLLKLDPAQQAHAINLAAIGNIALMQTRVGTLSMWKAAAAAYAARAGVFAALSAAHGMTAPALALDGTHGLFAQVTGVPEEGLFDLPVANFHLLDTHLKAYPSQYFTQTAITAALQAGASIQPQQISKVLVSTFEFGRVAAADTPEKWRPTTRETADHSMPYCVAIALLDGQVNESKFESACLQREDVRALMQRIEVNEDPALTAQYPEKVPTRIVLELQDGQHVQALCDYPLGHSRNPMTQEQVAAKFLDLSGHHAQSTSLLAQLRDIEALDGPRTAALLRLAVQI